MPEKNATGKDAGSKSAKASPAKKKKKRKSFFAQGVPAYTVVLIVVAALLGGLLISNMYNIPSISPGDIDTSLPQPVEQEIRAVTVVIENCDHCLEDDAVFQVLEQEGIQYEKRVYTLGSEDAQKVINELNLKSLPITLLAANSVKSAALKDGLDKAYVLRNGNYLIPGIVQKFIDVNSCAADNNITVDIFTDPYCEYCIRIKEFLSEDRVQFGYDYPRLKWHYNYIPTTSQNLFLKDGEERTELFAKTLLCAQKKGHYKLPAVEHAAYALYCDINEDEKLQVGELKNCKQSEHWGDTLSEGEIDWAVMEANLDQKEMDECRETEELAEEIEGYAEKAESFGIDDAPIAVVNCEYIMPIIVVDDFLCDYDPTLFTCEGMNETSG